MTFFQIILCVLVVAPFAFVGLIYGLLCFLDDMFYPRAIKEFKKLGLPYANEATASFDKVFNDTEYNSDSVATPTTTGFTLAGLTNGQYLYMAVHKPAQLASTIAGYG